MATVHFVKSARKDNETQGIKKGDSYYWWKFRHGGKLISKTRPKPSQLTQSEFWQAVLSLQEENDSAPAPDDIDSQVDSIKDRLSEIQSELEDKISNMEQSFPNGCPSLDTLNERKDAIESAISDIESADLSFDESMDDEERDDRAQEIWNDIIDALSSISCS